MNTPRPPDRDLDRLLDADRGDFAAVYDRLSRAEPPRRLDRAILAEASRVALGPQAPRTHRWMLGLGSAAGLVLAAGIAWQVGQQRDAEDSVPAAAAPRPAAVDVVPVQPITPRAPAAQDAVPEAAAGTAAASVVVEKKREAAPRRAAPAKPAPPPAAPPPPPVAAAELAAPAPASTPAEPLREEAEAFADDAAKAAPAEQRARDRSAASDHETSAKADQALSTRIGNAGGSRATSAPPAPSTSVQLRNNMQRDPEDWLAEILRLEHDGRRQEAIENLRLFRRVHPDWPIGERLRRLLE